MEVSGITRVGVVGAGTMGFHPPTLRYLTGFSMSRPEVDPKRVAETSTGF